MPKSIRELEEKQRPLEGRVLEFLVNDQENGYTLNEIIAGVESGGDKTQRALVLLVLQMTSMRKESILLQSQYEEALKKLIDRRQVRTFPDGSVTYYAATKAS